MFPKDLLDILACPKCKNSIKLDAKEEFFICENCKVKYPITDGIPELLIEKAQPLEEQ